MWRIAFAVGLCALPAVGLAETPAILGGNWTLDHGSSGAQYRLASRGTAGDFLICFEAGNMRQVTVSVGDETSVLARGACTVFAPTAEDGVILDFVAEATEHSVALGSFRLIPPPQEQWARN